MSERRRGITQSRRSWKFRQNAESDARRYLGYLFPFLNCTENETKANFPANFPAGMLSVCFTWRPLVMRYRLTLVVLLGLATAVYGKEPRHFQSGKLLQMASVPCGMAEKDAKTLTGELLGTDNSHK